MSPTRREVCNLFALTSNIGKHVQSAAHQFNYACNRSKRMLSDASKAIVETITDRAKEFIDAVENVQKQFAVRDKKDRLIEDGSISLLDGLLRCKRYRIVDDVAKKQECEDAINALTRDYKELIDDLSKWLDEEDDKDLKLYKVDGKYVPDMNTSIHDALMPIIIERGDECEK